MNIVLPSQFFYNIGNQNKAFVENGILYIVGGISFENLMYSITYSVKGYERCFYCGTELEHRRRTLDHMYPRMFGGVSIPDNLVPCCYSCNNTKSCLTTKQFIQWRTIRSKKIKEKSFDTMVHNNQKQFHENILLPKEWLTDYPISKVIETIDFGNIVSNSKKIKKLHEFYKKHHHYPKPVIITSNDWVLEGFHVLHHAQNHSIRFVPAIILDNVVHLPN